MNRFNLERALTGEKVITRDGREVTQLYVFTCDQEKSLYGVMDGVVEQWNCLGQYHAGHNSHDTNLFMAPKKLSGFVNVYANRYQPSPIHPTRESADEHCEPSNRLACVDLSQFDEGHGL